MNRLWIIAALALAHGAARAEPPLPQALKIPLPANANGLYWDAAEHALYLTDADRGELVRWTDASGFTDVAKLPASAGHLELGGLVRLPDGSFAIASFGFGTDGAVFVVHPDHSVTAVPKLDKTRRRLGLARGADGTLWVAYFTGDHARHAGGVATLDLTTGEHDVIAQGLGKPVGVIATSAGVFVSDQDRNAIYKIAGGALQPFATGLPGVDLLAAMPDGTLLTGGKSGTIVKIAPDGKSTVLGTRYEALRGIAYDPDQRRLFVVEHGKTASHRMLYVLPMHGT